MQQIYQQKLWGGNTATDFYSGEGSHNINITKPYIDAVSTFLKLHNSNLTVCDLGCGDFNIGKYLYQYTKHYIGIDIVEHLITRNKTLFKDDNLEFRCLDISKDQIPKADCIILRQVLQHLSNAEIQDILKQLTAYKYIILTEHLPTGNFTPNKDKIASQGIRLKQHSGIDVKATPFNLTYKSETVINECVLKDNKSKIVTYLYVLD